MAITYGDVVYNPFLCYVAGFDTVDNEYGTPVILDYFGDFSFEYEHDSDEIISGGLAVEKLSILKQITGAINNAALAWPALVAMTGISPESTDGTTPNQTSTLFIEAGGQGLGYFGAIVACASLNGAEVLIGLPKMMLDTHQGFTMAQNQFRKPEVNFTAIAPSQTLRRTVRLTKYETAGTFPSSQANFQAFMQPMLDS